MTTHKYGLYVTQKMITAQVILRMELEPQIWETLKHLAYVPAIIQKYVRNNTADLAHADPWLGRVELLKRSQRVIDEIKQDYRITDQPTGKELNQ